MGPFGPAAQMPAAASEARPFGEAQTRKPTSLFPLILCAGEQRLSITTMLFCSWVMNLLWLHRTTQYF